MLWFPILKIFITILIIVLAAGIIVIPAPIKHFVAKHTPPSDYLPNTNATVEKNYTLYQKKNNVNEVKKLIVWFHGGAFIFSDRKTTYGLLNRIHDKIGDTFDILVFDYPTRFKYTLHDSMIAINKILSQFSTRYSDFYAGSLSAGTLLMGAFINKEKNPQVALRMKVPIIGVQFKAAIAICGLFETKFDSTLINTLFRFYILRGTPAAELYTCYNNNLPFMTISFNTDYLYIQTVKFITTQPTKYFIYTNPLLPHTFALLSNLNESRDCVERIVEFIKNHQ